MKKYYIMLVFLIVFMLYACSNQTTLTPTTETTSAEFEITVEEGILKWRYTDEAWQDLFDLETLQGLGIKSLIINNQGELIIIYSDDSEVNLGSLNRSFLIQYFDKEGNLIYFETVLMNEDADPPAMFDLNGYTFLGWDQELTNITENLIVKPLYEVKQFNLSFYSEFPVSIMPVTFNYGETMQLPIPTFNGYTFLGWFLGTDVNSAQVYDNTHFFADTNLYARWQPSSTILVSNEEELFSAISNYRYTEIILANDITVMNMITINRPLTLNGNGYRLGSFSSNYIINITEIVNLVDELHIDPNYGEIKILNLEISSMRNIINMPIDGFIRVSGVDNLTLTIDSVRTNGISRYGLNVLESNDIKAKILNSYFIAENQTINIFESKHSFNIIESQFDAAIGISTRNCVESVLIVSKSIFNLIDNQTLENAVIKTQSSQLTTNRFYDCQIYFEAPVGEVVHLSLNLADTNPQYMLFENCYIETSHPVISDLLYSEMAITNFNLVGSIIKIKEGVKEIPDFGFKNANYLKGVILPSTLESIGNEAFSYCYYLNSIIIPEGVTSIGNMAFSSTGSLGSIYLPSTLINVGSELFKWGYYNTQIYLHEDIDTSLWDADWNLDNQPVINDALGTYSQDGISYLALNNYEAYIIDNSLLEKTNLVVPETISFDSNTFSITRINAYSFYRNKSLETISLPQSLKYIGFSAFSTNSNLSSVFIPENSEIEIIDNSAFYGCSNLRSFTIPPLVTVVNNSTFSDCRNLVEVDFSLALGLTEIKDNAFSGNSNLRSITIPDSVVVIGTNAFSFCYMLEEIILSPTSQLEYIKNSAFYYNYSLKSIYIPASVISIGASSFSSARSVEEVVFAENSQLTSIGSSAFSWLVNLKSIILPSSLQTLESYVFYFCESLESIYIPEGVTILKTSLFVNCVSLTQIEFENIRTLTTIEIYAFYGVKNLSSFYIPDTVTTIGEKAFINIDYIVIYCQATSKPAGWASDWNFDNQPVVWGYPG